MQQRFAPLLVIFAGCCWATMGVFVRLFNEWGLFTIQIVTVRTIVTVFIFALLILIQDRNLFRIKLKDIPYFLGTGCFGVALFNLCYYNTIAVSSLSIAAILLYTAPIFVMIFSVPLFGEKMTGRKLTALALAFAGCVLVSGILTGGSAGLTLKAFVIGIISGIGYALFTVFSKYAVERGYTGTTITFYTFVLASGPCIALADFGQITGAMAAGGVPIILLMIVFGLITTLIPNLAYLQGLKYVETGKASIMASIEPVMATLFGLVLFAEVPTIRSFAGMCLVVDAIVLLNLKEKSAPQPEGKQEDAT